MRRIRRDIRLSHLQANAIQTEMIMLETQSINIYNKTSQDDSSWFDSDLGGGRGLYSADTLPPHYNRNTTNGDDDVTISGLDNLNLDQESDDRDSFTSEESGSNGYTFMIDSAMSVGDESYKDWDSSTNTEPDSNDGNSVIDLTSESPNDIENPIDLTHDNDNGVNQMYDEDIIMANNIILTKSTHTSTSSRHHQ